MSIKLHCLVIVGFLAYLTAGKRVQDAEKKDYFAIVQKQTFNDALNICKTQKLQLAAIKDKTENTDVGYNVRNFVGAENDRKFWTSGKNISAGWQWMSNGKTVDWFDWGSGKKNGTSADAGDCILFTLNHFEKGSWMKASCDEKHSVLCETPLD